MKNLNKQISKLQARRERAVRLAFLAGKITAAQYEVRMAIIQHEAGDTHQWARV